MISKLDVDYWMSGRAATGNDDCENAPWTKGGMRTIDQ